MDKLSELIKEAKPLYKQRKRNKTIAKIVLSISFPVILFSSFVQIYSQGSELYLSLEDNNLQNQLVIDEYGLLR